MLKKLFLIMSLLVLPALADTTEEINHLINYVKTSKCSYIRDGKTYTGSEGAKHITAKYDYYKDKINTAEDFIRLSATKSILLGTKYYIECPGSPKVESKKWLLEELKKFRSK
ncbi:hypothetical protein MNB_SV-5-1787 [hydrothermal vent metagenome]|uniref:Uncharacterized protein n=1 Tax=hydrothermal vent metagenome TaxID=652676 RepID=A0A1W1EE17_9ZZZZ